MKSVIAIALVWAVPLHAQIGIGTVNPSSNAVLDVNSANKGLMLPRLADTGSVSNPSAGLMIFNMQAKALAFHDGARWTNLGSNESTADSLTYTFIARPPGLHPGIFPLFTLTNSITHSGLSNADPVFAGIKIMKPLDANSVGIAQLVATQLYGPGGGNTVLEIKSYTRGAATPNFSIKLTEAKFLGYQVSLVSGLKESIDITARIYGYKNWIDNTSFSINALTGALGNY